jgi:hypothetical protein
MSLNPAKVAPSHQGSTNLWERDTLLLCQGSPRAQAEELGPDEPKGSGQGPRVA